MRWVPKIETTSGTRYRPTGKWTCSAGNYQLITFLSLIGTEFTQDKWCPNRNFSCLYDDHKSIHHRWCQNWENHQLVITSSTGKMHGVFTSWSVSGRWEIRSVIALLRLAIGMYGTNAWPIYRPAIHQSWDHFAFLKITRQKNTNWAFNHTCGYSVTMFWCRIDRNIIRWSLGTLTGLPHRLWQLWERILVARCPCIRVIWLCVCCFRFDRCFWCSARGGRS